jgi:hypothetical protein
LAVPFAALGHFSDPDLYKNFQCGFLKAGRKQEQQQHEPSLPGPHSTKQARNKDSNMTTLQRRRPSKREIAYMRNFNQYILAGMIANLHNVNYMERKTDERVSRIIGVAIDAIDELRTILKEAHRG